MMALKHIRTNQGDCVKCGKLLDTATDPYKGAELITPGDVSVCLYCANIMIFDENAKLRPPTATELVEVMKDASVLRLIHAVKGK